MTQKRKKRKIMTLIRVLDNLDVSQDGPAATDHQSTPSQSFIQPSAFGASDVE